jgi:hypothetical protein
MPIGLSGVQLGSAQSIASNLQTSNGKSWDSLVQGVHQQISRISTDQLKYGMEGPQKIGISKVGNGQLIDLLKLQVDLHRCQVKVELLSKVSESATAAFRKLEQGQ